jgi:Tol biopolymer transport system component
MDKNNETIRYRQESDKKIIITTVMMAIIILVLFAILIGLSTLVVTFGTGTPPRPSGKIAFQSDRDAARGEIYAMNAEDGSGLTRLTYNNESDILPVWSPDGTKIAFSSVRNSTNSEIYVINGEDGSGLTRLVNETYPFLSWSPDGTKIAFSKNTRPPLLAEGDRHIDTYVMNAEDGSGLTRLTYISKNNGFPAWSPDGTKIAFSSETGRRDSMEIHVVDAQVLGTPTRLTKYNESEFTYGVDTFATDEFPAWSPDGTKIAFIRSIINDDNEFRLQYVVDKVLYVMNAEDGSGLTRLINGSSGLPIWSPDGTKIAVARSHDIYVMNAEDGSGLTRLTYDGYNSNPSWSPDGTKIAFSSTRDGDDDREIYVMNAEDGSGLTRLTYNNAHDTNPSWSPMVN